MYRPTAILNFYPRPHMEGDRLREKNEDWRERFLPTPSHGGRLLMAIIPGLKPKFLPTPSHGGRHGNLQQVDLADVISTHALTWRATSPGRENQQNAEISTHALTWRATSAAVIFALTAAHFYPRPHMEGDNPAGAG